MTKKAQLQKTKRKNPKRLDPCELRAYKDSILDVSGGICQLCSEERAVDMHHSLYGSRGADKDDRSLVAVCRDCHDKCHQSKHGALNSKAKEIGIDNWREYNG